MTFGILRDLFLGGGSSPTGAGPLGGASYMDRLTRMRQDARQSGWGASPQTRSAGNGWTSVSDSLPRSGNLLSIYDRHYGQGAERAAREEAARAYEAGYQAYGNGAYGGSTSASGAANGSSGSTGSATPNSSGSLAEKLAAWREEVYAGGAHAVAANGGSAADGYAAEYGDEYGDAYAADYAEGYAAAQEEAAAAYYGYGAAPYGYDWRSADDGRSGLYHRFADDGRYGDFDRYAWGGAPYGEDLGGYQSGYAAGYADGYDGLDYNDSGYAESENDDSGSGSTWGSTSAAVDSRPLVEKLAAWREQAYAGRASSSNG